MKNRIVRIISLTYTNQYGLNQFEIKTCCKARIDGNVYNSIEKIISSMEPVIGTKILKTAGLEKAMQELRKFNVQY